MTNIRNSSVFEYKSHTFEIIPENFKTANDNFKKYLKPLVPYVCSVADNSKGRDLSITLLGTLITELCEEMKIENALSTFLSNTKLDGKTVDVGKQYAKDTTLVLFMMLEVFDVNYSSFFTNPKGLNYTKPSKSATKVRGPGDKENPTEQLETEIAMEALMSKLGITEDSLKDQREELKARKPSEDVISPYQKQIDIVNSLQHIDMYEYMLADSGLDTVTNIRYHWTWNEVFDYIIFLDYKKMLNTEGV